MRTGDPPTVCSPKANGSTRPSGCCAAGFDLSEAESDLIAASKRQALRNRSKRRTAVAALGVFAVVALVLFVNAERNRRESEKNFTVARTILDESVDILSREELRVLPGIQDIRSVFVRNANKHYEDFARPAPWDLEVDKGLGRVEANLAARSSARSGRSLDESINNFKDSTKRLGQAARQNPKDAEARWHWAVAEKEFGFTLSQYGQEQDARPHLETAYRELKRRPESARPPERGPQTPLALGPEKPSARELKNSNWGWPASTAGSSGKIRPNKAALYDEAARLFDELRKGQWRRPDCLVGLARAKVNKSRLESNDTAKALCDEALALCQAALNETPQNPLYLAIESASLLLPWHCPLAASPNRRGTRGFEEIDRD